jgi:uncharacterized protein (DUF58 family)
VDRSWRSGRESPSALLRFGISTEELARAARLLMVRSRREATGLFSGNYASAFRGGGLEFEESRPYQPGDDVRSIDWNATARHRATYVKHFREERDQSLLFVLDASASMRAGHPLRSKAATAAHAVALLCAAAGRAGDRVGLVVFDDSVREVVPVARGVAHGWRVVQTAVDAAATPRGNTRLEAALRAVRIHGRRRTVAVVLSDFHESPGHDERRRRDAVWTLRQALGELSRRHDVVAAPILDRLELALPRVGHVRVADPERPGRSWVLDTGSRRTRRRYLTACAERRRKLADSMRHSGADLLWLRTDQNPLHALRRLFHERAARRHRVGS